MKKSFRFKSSRLTVPDMLIGVMLSASSVFVCAGYLFAVYMPELRLQFLAFLCIPVAVVLAVSYAISSKILPGFLGIAAVGGLMLFFENIRIGILNIPDFIVKKIEVIAYEIYEYSPDYTTVLTEADKATVIICTALFVVLLSAVFAVCFFKGHGHGLAFFVVTACASLAFLGHEKSNTVFLLCSVALCFVISGSSGMFGQRHMQHKRVLAAALAFFTIAGVLNAFSEDITDVSDRISESMGLDALKGSITGDTIPPPDEMYAVSPDGRHNSYADVVMTDIGFSDKILFESYTDYRGTMYLYNGSYYKYNHSMWSNYKKDMVFLQYQIANGAELVKNDLITSTGRGMLVRKDLKSALPDYVWCYNKVDDLYHGEQSYRAALIRTHPINSPSYIDIIDEQLDRINRLPDGIIGSDFYDSAVQKPELEQNYNSDVDFAALAKSLLSKYDPNEVGFKEAFYALRDYFATKSYTTSPTSSENYRNYDKNKSALYNFLFNTNEGYCVHFATAATLLLREMGYTTRYSVGYVFGSVENEFVPIYDRSSHAWVEVFVDGIGWLPLEMTVGFGDFSSEETSSDESSASGAFEESSDEPSSEENSRDFSYDESIVIIPGISNDESDDKPFEGSDFPTVALICVLLVVAIIILVVLLVRRARAESDSKRRRFTELPEDDEKLLPLIKEEWRFVLGVLALMGLQPLAGEDIAAFASRIAETSQEIPSLTQIVDIFLAAEFGSKAERGDALSCGAYAVSLNDHAVRHIRLLKRLRAYLSGKLLVRPK